MAAAVVAEGVVHWCLRSSQPGEHNEADLESNKIDSTLLLKGTPLRPPMSSSSWSLQMVAASFSQVEAARDCRVSVWNVRNVCGTNGWFWICETAENAAWRSQMKRARTPCRISKILTAAWNPDGTGVICRNVISCRRCLNWCGLRAQELQVLLV